MYIVKTVVAVISNKKAHTYNFTRRETYNLCCTQLVNYSTRLFFAIAIDYTFQESPLEFFIWGGPMLSQADFIVFK